MREESRKRRGGSIDWSILSLPFLLVVIFCGAFFLYPEHSKTMLHLIREYLGNNWGVYYLMLGVFGVVVSLYMALSKYGDIRLGKDEKPQYTNFQWGAMIFTSTMAADILFYSLCEWSIYISEPYVREMGSVEKWVPAISLFHWGPIAWSFYIILGVSFGFMLHVRGRKKQKFSEACRPVLGHRVDGILGKSIDLLAVLALLAGTATTFSLATPLLSEGISKILGIQPSMMLTILLLLSIAFIYTLTVWFGMEGVLRLATCCTFLFFLFLGYVFFLGGESRFILESGFSSLGTLVQNFVGLATWTDPSRKTSFPQNWTMFYWAYWMAWCIATPFFLGMISKGRTIRSTVFGIYGWGLGGTFLSFIVLGNYGLSKEIAGEVKGEALLKSGEQMSGIILKVLETLPNLKLVLVILVVTMIAFYATTFDALTMVVSVYSYKNLPTGTEPDRKIRAFWAILFILLPIALLFSEHSMNQLQSVSIIAAFPIGGIMMLIILSFFRDAKAYLRENRKPC